VLHARCVVITVPAGVLREESRAGGIAFSPPLPAETHAALRGLEMGHAVRVTLAFRTPFWEELAGGRYRDAAFFRCEAGAFRAFWTQLPLRGRTITAWAGGPRAAALRDVPEPERVERALAAFGAMFGADDAARRAFEGGVTHDWSADPFARGAYSYVVTGAGGARSQLAAPVDGVLFFAGEATVTDGQGGTVSGAFGSGTRAAREAAGALARVAE
jgi:monoamine oxidase